MTSLAIINSQVMSFTWRLMTVKENSLLGGWNIFLANRKFWQQLRYLGSQTAK
jgi:hypothetical protein